MGLGDNIRYLRTKLGFSQDYIAEKLGYKSYTTIQKWESGVSEPPIKKLKELSVLLNVDMNELASGNLQLNEEKLPTDLTSKDKRDIKKNVDNIMESLENGDVLYYDGIEVHLTDETKALLRNALTIAMQAVKIENKKIRCQ